MFTPRSAALFYHEAIPASYIYFAAQFKCQHCYNIVSIKSVDRYVRCDQCGSVSDLDASFWQFLEVLRVSLGGCAPDHVGKFQDPSYQLEVEWGPGTPICQHCRSNLASDDVKTGYTGSLTCAVCGQVTQTYGGLDWLRPCNAVYWQFFGDEQCGNLQDIKPKEREHNTAEGKGVAVLCKNCNGSMSLTSIESRIVTCPFCQSRTYLSDDIWSQLSVNPDKHYIFVRFAESVPAQTIGEVAGAQISKKGKIFLSLLIILSPLLMIAFVYMMNYIQNGHF